MDEKVRKDRLYWFVEDCINWLSYNRVTPYTLHTVITHTFLTSGDIAVMDFDVALPWISLLVTVEFGQAALEMGGNLDADL